jgi:hypothetical protein
VVGTVLAWATLESTGSLWLAFIVARLIGFIVGAFNPADGDPADPRASCQTDDVHVYPVAAVAGIRLGPRSLEQEPACQSVSLL